MQHTDHSGASLECHAATACVDAFQLAKVQPQDPAAFAHLLADHFVAREASSVAFAKPQLLVGDSVDLGTFKSWQFSERCLATYRVLFGRPLWAGVSPRPRKRKHATDGGSDPGNAERLPTVDELLEFPTTESLALASKTHATVEDENVLMDLAIDFETGLEPAAEEDAIDLLWALHASDDDEGVTLKRDEEVRFLNTFAICSEDTKGI